MIFFPKVKIVVNKEIDSFSSLKTNFLQIPFVKIYEIAMQYENTPIQIYRKFYLQKLKIFR